MSGKKMPRSILNLQKELKKAEKEVENLQTQYDNAAYNESVQFSDSGAPVSTEQPETIDLATQLENARDKAEKLNMELSSALKNIDGSEEIISLSSQLDLMNNKLSQTKNEAQQTGEELEDALNQKGNNLLGGLGKINGKMIKVAKTAALTGGNMARSFSNRTIGKQITSIGDKLDHFKSRVTRLIGAVAIFNVLRNSLSNLKNNFTGLLNSNDQFSSSLNQIKANLMTAFAPIYNAILPAINSLMQTLSQATGTIATFVSSLFGISVKDATKQAKQLSSALEDAASSGEDASGSLASFDKLEVIGGDSGSSGGSSGTGIDYNGAVQSNSELLSILNNIKNMIMSGDWGGIAKGISDAFISGLSYISNAIASLDFSGIGNNISEFLTNIDFSGIFTGLVSVFGEAVLGLQDLLLNVDWPAVFSNLSSGLVDAILNLNSYVNQINFSGLGAMISNTFTSIDWSGLGNSLIMTLWNSISGLGAMFLNIDWEQVGSTLSEAFNGILTNIINLFAETDWLLLGADIGDAIADFILNVDWANLGCNILLGLANGITAAVELVVGCFFTLVDRILEFFGIHSPSTLFAEMGTNLMLGLVEGIKGIINSVVSVFKELWNTIKNGAKNAWSGIKNVFSSVASFFKNIFSNAWTAVKNVFSIGGKIFDGIKDGILNAFKTVVNKLIDGTNKVVALPFDGINGMLNKIRNVEFLGISPFRSLWKQNPIGVPQIPHLAKGTVIPPRQEFLAVLGDQKKGTNIEAPLDTIKQANREVMEEFMDMIMDMNNTTREIILKNLTFVIQLGSKDFRKVVMEAVRLSEKELGKPLFVS